MQGIIAFPVHVVDVDSRLCKDPHDVAMATPRGNPERIQSIFILLINVNHLVLQHESHKSFTIE